MAQPRRRTPAKSLSGSEAPALLRLVYLVVPKHVVNRILPPDASLSRQAATLYAACFVVGAGMEAFMVKTGFYAVATRKEAERQALAKWEREETARLKADRDRSRLEREKIDREHYCMRLQEELHALRVQERDTGLKMDEEKLKVKQQLKEIGRQLKTSA